MAVAEEKRGFIRRTGDFIHEVKGEMRKVTWPTKGELYGATFVVVTVNIVLSIILGLGDTLLGHVIEFLMATK